MNGKTTAIIVDLTALQRSYLEVLLDQSSASADPNQISKLGY